MRSVWTIERTETLLHHVGIEIAFLLLDGGGGGGTAKAIAMNKGYAVIELESCITVMRRFMYTEISMQQWMVNNMSTIAIEIDSSAMLR